MGIPDVFELEGVNDAVLMLKVDRSVATAFFVLPGFAATCRHCLVSDNPSDIELTWDDRRVDVLEVMLPSGSAEDIGLLRLDLHEHPVLPVGPPSSPLSEVYSYSYQYIDRGYRGYPILGRLGGTATDTAEDSELLVITGPSIAPGASGAPVYSLDDRRVVGLIKRHNPDGGGYAVDASVLENVRPGLLEENAALAGPMGSPTPIDGYLRIITEENTHVALAGLQREVRLDDVFVSLTVAPHTVTGQALSVTSSGRLDVTADRRLLKVDARQDLGGPTAHFIQRRVSLQEVAVQRKALLLGEPGVGKTTLLRHLSRKAAGGTLYHHRVPVFVPLGLLDIGVGCVRDYTESAYRDHRAPLSEAILQGRIVFFLDGLDEVDPAKQSVIASEAQRLAAGGNTVLITCRYAAFPTGLFSSDYQTYYCVGFSRAQQQRFLFRWYSGDETRALSLFRQMEQQASLRGFARNPLLLSMAAIAADSDPSFRLPTSRGDLYEEVVGAHLRRRPRLKGRFLSFTGRLQFLEQFAFEMQTGGTEFVPESVVIEKISTADELGSFRNRPDELLAHFVEQDGMLQRRGTTLVGFAHRTFQEYLTARYWKTHPPGEAELFHRALDPRWEEVVRLHVSQLPQEKVDRIVESLLVGGESDQDPLAVDRILLAARCASETSEISTALASRLSDVLLQLLHSAEADPVRPDVVSALGLLCSSNDGAMARVEQAVVTVDKTRGWRTPLGKRVIEVLGAIDRTTVTSTLLRILKHLDDDSTLLAEQGLLAMGSTVESLGSTRGDAATEPLLALLEHPSSFLAATAATQVAERAQPSHHQRLKRLWNGPRGVAQLLAGFVLLRSYDPRNQIEVFKEGLLRGSDQIAALATQAVDPELLLDHPEVVPELLRLDVDDRRLSHLLGLPADQLRVISHPWLHSLVSDEARPSRLRCAACGALLRLDPTAAREILPPLLDEPVDQNLIRTALTALREMRSTEAHEVLADRVGSSSPRWLLSACQRLVAAAPTAAAGEWLQELARSWPEHSAKALGALPAMCICLPDRSRAMVERYLAQPPSDNVRSRVSAYRALARVPASAAADLVCQYLFEETDTTAITEGIKALFSTGGKLAEEALLRCLRPSAWPDRWPSPMPPLRRGDQRPADRRQLAAIVGLSRIGTERGIESLLRVFHDGNASPETRRAAHLALRTIRWREGEAG